MTPYYQDDAVIPRAGIGVTPREQRLRQRIDQLTDERTMLRLQVANLSKRLAHKRDQSNELYRQRRRAEMWEVRAGGPYARTSRARRNP